MYGMESLVQLADHVTGVLPHSTVTLTDTAQYNWRGLMIDSGRRFFPVDLVKNLLDTMAAVKMNVLHLHASDMCRFGVESKLHPELTESLTGIKAGYYSQDDIAELEAYANSKGIRLVPEFDVPGHSRGFRPIQGIDFCTTDDSQSQLYGSNATYDIVHDVLKEMSGLFSDKVRFCAVCAGMTGPASRFTPLSTSCLLPRYSILDVTRQLPRACAQLSQLLTSSDGSSRRLQRSSARPPKAGKRLISMQEPLPTRRLSMHGLATLRPKSSTLVSK